MGQANKKANKKDVRLHFNIMLIGDSGVGKHELFDKYSTKKFDQNKMVTTGVDFLSLKQ